MAAIRSRKLDSMRTPQLCHGKVKILIWDHNRDGMLERASVPRLQYVVSEISLSSCSRKHQQTVLYEGASNLVLGIWMLLEMHGWPFQHVRCEACFDETFVRRLGDLPASLIKRLSECIFSKARLGYGKYSLQEDSIVVFRILVKGLVGSIVGALTIAHLALLMSAIKVNSSSRRSRSSISQSNSHVKGRDAELRRSTMTLLPQSLSGALPTIGTAAKMQKQPRIRQQAYVIPQRRRGFLEFRADLTLPLRIQTAGPGLAVHLAKPLLLGPQQLPIA